ncbi:hypothetical protein J4221_05525 [Candidatus Pacearchaeota archaeon]|nr:hypothetical protein [Candidatus Pacearchaeota archaeon]
MNLDLEKAQIMFKLIRKDNWGACYDRFEHFKSKRFQNLDKCIKELSKAEWVIIHNKPKFTALSLNTQHKGETIEFIEKQMPHLKGVIK